MSMTTLLRDLGIGGDYPLRWADFVGQEQVKRQLQVAAASAKKRKEVLEHILLAAGAPGVGKTSLALLVAAELGRRVKMVSGQMSILDARLALAEMRRGDVLFIDEIHQLVKGGKGNAEWLLHLLQDGVILGPLGAEPQPPITIIGATTDAGRLPDTILSRFPIKPTLVDYSDDEGVQIVGKLAKRTLGGLPAPSPSVAAQIAEAGNNNPREIRSILINVRDIATVTGVPRDGNYDLTEALAWNGLTFDGLNAVATKYLTVLLKEFKGQAGEKSMQDRLQEPGGVGGVERLLMKKGLIAKTRSGRTLTQLGIFRTKELMT